MELFNFVVLELVLILIKISVVLSELVFLEYITKVLNKVMMAVGLCLRDVLVQSLSVDNLVESDKYLLQFIPILKEECPVELQVIGFLLFL